MPEAMPASGTGGGTVPDDSAADPHGRARLTDDVRRVADTLADAVNAVPLDRRAVVAEHLSSAMQQLASLVGDVLRRSVSAAPDAPPPGAALPPGAAPRPAGAGSPSSPPGPSAAPVGASPAAAGPSPSASFPPPPAMPPVADVPAAPAAPPGALPAAPAFPPAAGVPAAPPAIPPAADVPAAPAAPTAAEVAGAPRDHAADEGSGIDATASLATRLVAQARHRRGVYGDPSRGVLDDPGLRPPPQVTAASVVPFSDDPDRPDRRRRGAAGPSAAEPAALVGPSAARSQDERPEGTRRSDPVVASLQWAVAAGRAVIVGFADVVGVADPGTATRLLQTRVLATLQPGDVAVMVGPGEVAFVLLDADLVEADRRFRHLVTPPTGGAPAVRLGFVVPRAGEDPADVVARARTAATGRWSRVRVGRPT